MAGPKYIDRFNFPSDFGFSGSATDRTTTTVRSHERAKPTRFAKGGKVSVKLRKRPVGDTIQGGTQVERMKSLGLKKGGSVKRMKDC